MQQNACKHTDLVRLNCNKTNNIIEPCKSLKK